ncbi:MAG: type I-B CRISPR-associated protein Cas7/Cst2/DevR, partial [Thermodesulfobacteriota bacterium]
MSKHVIGLVLIDAPHSALNNAGTEASQSTENTVVVKTIRKGRSTYPYVSGQAWRNWWRMTLEKEFKWRLSPIERESKIAFTAANPVDFDDDDLFGYMRAQSIEIEEEGKKPKKQNITVTRLSPLKCSPLVSIEPQQPTNDFGVMARHEGDPVPYEHQFYSTILKGIFSLDLNAVGTFWNINKTGYKNISEQYADKIKAKGGKQSDEKSPWILPKEIRLKRSKDVIKALSVISGGANLTSHLTDVTPKLIVLGIIEGGNHPFMNLMVEKDGKGEFSIQA